MADSSSEKSSSSSDEESSGSVSSNEFDRKKNNEPSRQKKKMTENSRRRAAAGSSSPERQSSHVSADKKEKKYRQKISKESDDSSSSSSSDDEMPQKKHKSASAGRKPSSYNNTEDDYKRSVKNEGEMRNRIKERYIKHEFEDKSHRSRKQYDGGSDRKKHSKDLERKHDYNANERYIKNEDGSRYKLDKHIKKEDYNEDIKKDHRKRKNEYRNNSPDDHYEKKYHRHIKKEEDDYNEDAYRERDDRHIRKQNENDRKRHSKDHKKHERKSHPDKNAVREWDRGKNSDDDWDNADFDSLRFGKNSQAESTDGKPPGKEEANFGLSGKLTEFTNTYNGIVIMYNEPPEARKPKTKWRFYPFKGEKSLTMLQLHRQSAFLLGRDRKVADIPVDHPSCSKQHAVLQFRLVDFERPDGSMGKRVKPYIIDLDSRNGTHVNNKRIEGRVYVELMEKDVVKFGFSTRDYVLLHEKSQDVRSSEDEGSDDEAKQPKNK